MLNMNPQMMRPDQEPEVFRFTNGHMIDHPTYGTSVLWDNMHLFAILPIGGEQIQYNLTAFPPNTWVGLQDRSGQPIPVAVCVDSRGVVLGRWLP